MVDFVSLIKDDSSSECSVAARRTVNAGVVLEEPIKVRLKLCLIRSVSGGRLARVTGVISPGRVEAFLTGFIPRYTTTVALWSDPLKVGIQPQHGGFGYLSPVGAYGGGGENSRKIG